MRRRIARGAIRGTTILCSMAAIVIVAGPAAGDREARMPTESATAVKSVERVAMLVDATDSVNTTIPGGSTRRDAYLTAARSIIRAVQHAGLPLTMGRTCGISEVLWDATVTRKDFATLTALIGSALRSCDGQTSAVRSGRRQAGTDLIGGLDWLARQRDTAVLVYITDGLNTLSASGASPSADFLRALDRLPANVRGRLWIIGVDEAVRDAVASRVPHSSGLFDLQPAAERLTAVIKRRTN